MQPMSTSPSLPQIPPTPGYTFQLDEVIRLCGSLLTPFRYGTIMDETFEFTNPLSIVDCARLAMVSKEVRKAVENNECWKDVLDVLEQDFPLVPFYSKEMEEKDMPYPEGLEGSTELFPNDWRKELGEPRYDVEAWAALNFKQKVPLLLAFALKISKTMKEESMDMDSMDWEYIVPDEMLNRSVGKRFAGVWSDPGYYAGVWTEEDRDKAYHWMHIQANYPTRYDMACALAHCCLLEDGLPRGPVDSPRSRGMYYEVNNLFNGDGTCNGSSYPNMMYERIFHVPGKPCGTDEHLQELCDLDNGALFDETMFGERIFKLLKVAPTCVAEYWTTFRDNQRVFEEMSWKSLPKLEDDDPKLTRFKEIEDFIPWDEFVWSDESSDEDGDDSEED